MIYPNSWQPLTVVEVPHWGGNQRFEHLTKSILMGVDFEYLVPDGSITKYAYPKSWYDTETRTSHYDYTLTAINGDFYPIAEIKWRFEDKPYQKVRTLLDLIMVGDFIKAKSRANDWRKVISINERGSIYGQGYKEPINDPKYAKLTSSENMMVNITHVVSEAGVKVYGK